MTIKTVEPIDPAEIRELLALYDRGLDKPQKRPYIRGSGALSLAGRRQKKKSHPRACCWSRQVYARRPEWGRLSPGAALLILEQYLDVARHAPEVHAIGTEPAVTHSQGEAPYTWQWAAEVYGALWETGQAVYGRAVMPDELVIVRAATVREIRDHATVLIRNAGTRYAALLGSQEAIVLRLRDCARREFVRLTRPDTAIGARYGHEVMVFVDELEAHRVRPLRM